MRHNILRTALAISVILSAVAVTSCGSTSTITSLTDSDSAAETIEAIPSTESGESVVSDTVSATEQQTADGVPEIAAQTIVNPSDTGEEQTGTDTSSENAADEEAYETGRTSEASAGQAVQNSEEEPEAVMVDTDEETVDQSVDEDTEVDEDVISDWDDEDEDVENPSDLDDADRIDIEETDEGGVHGEGNTATLAVAQANVRSDPWVDDEDDNTIGILYEGDEVVVLGNEDGWYRISYEGQTGYVSAHLFN